MIVARRSPWSTRWCTQQQQQQQTFGSAAATAKTARLRTDEEYIRQVD